MKLPEIQKKTFAELLGEENIFDITEMFNSTIPINFAHDGQDLVGYVEVDGDRYKVSLEPAEYHGLPGKTFNIVNLSFAVWDKAKKEFTTEFQGTRKSGSKIMGVMYNAWINELKKLKYDAVWFYADDRVETRMNIYNYIAKKMSSWGGLGGSVRENVRCNDGKLLTILYRKDMMADEHDEIEAHIQKLERTK